MRWPSQRDVMLLQCSPVTSRSLLQGPDPSPEAGHDLRDPAGPEGGPRAVAGADTPPMIDLCGEVCPFTFVRTKLALEDLPMGALLRVIVDHEPATRNIPRSATEWGQEVLAVTNLAPRTWAIDLRKRVR
jgi:tRNA 2-thiouridine synthesizing protein A